MPSASSRPGDALGVVLVHLAPEGADRRYGAVTATGYRPRRRPSTGLGAARLGGSGWRCARRGTPSAQVTIVRPDRPASCARVPQRPRVEVVPIRLQVGQEAMAGRGAAEPDVGASRRSEPAVGGDVADGGPGPADRAVASATSADRLGSGDPMARRACRSAAGPSTPGTTTWPGASGARPVAASAVVQPPPALVQHRATSAIDARPRGRARPAGDASRSSRRRAPGTAATARSASTPVTRSPTLAEARTRLRRTAGHDPSTSARRRRSSPAVPTRPTVGRARPSTAGGA